MAVITMTRELGTLGKDVVAGLAERLGLDVIHHELFEHDIAEGSGLSESEVHRFLEGEASLLERTARIPVQECVDYIVRLAHSPAFVQVTQIPYSAYHYA